MALPLQILSFYQKECALYLWHHLEVPAAQLSLDRVLPPTLKVSFQFGGCCLARLFLGCCRQRSRWGSSFRFDGFYVYLAGLQPALKVGWQWTGICR